MTPYNTLKSLGIVELNVKEKWLFWCLWLEMILPLFYCLTQVQEFPNFQLVWRLWICVFALSIKTVSSMCCFSIGSPLVSLVVAFLDISNILYNVNYLIYLNRPDLQISWKPSKSITFYICSAVLRLCSRDLPSVFHFKNAPTASISFKKIKNTWVIS